jgi:hypothetical protein
MLRRRRALSIAPTALLCALLSQSFLNPAPAFPQDSSRPPQLSPAAAYEKVWQPVVLTRASVANWSDSELGALAVAIADAQLECAARSPQMFRGDDLIALARLCSLGQQWSSVSVAATQYIDSAETPKPLLAQAYALKVDAALQLRDEPAALATSRAMLAAVPYDTTVDQALNESLHYMQIAFMADALSLYAAREPFLLAGLRGQGAAKPVPAGPSLSAGSTNSTGPVGAANPADTVPVSALYADGLAYAALEQFAGKPAKAASIVQEIDSALASAPTPLTPDDAIPIADARRQYALLGKPLPTIPIAVSLYAEHESPRINTNYGDSTVLLLFPPWCAQCVRMGQGFMSTLFRLNSSEDSVHLYGLLAQEPPPVPATPEVIVHSNGSMSAAKRSRSASSRANAAPEAAPAPETPKTAAELLRHTPTLIVPVDTLKQFAATSFPLLIATDSQGVVRFIQPAPETALNPGDFLDQVTTHIAKQWPRPKHQTGARNTAPPSTP